MSDRRFPPPWSIERLPGGYKVIDANGQSLAYFYARENDHDANTAGVLTHGRGKADGEQLRQAAAATEPRLSVPGDWARGELHN